MRKVRRRVIRKIKPMTQPEAINGLSHSFPDIRLLNYGGDFTTSRALRDKGVIVCSDCGELCSDSEGNCPQCESKLIAIVTEDENIHIEAIKAESSIINKKDALRTVIRKLIK